MFSKAKVLIVGLGEVGFSLYSIALESRYFEVYGYDVDPGKTINKMDEIPKNIDYLHITIPYAKTFTDIVVDYVNVFKPKYVIIHSSVAPGVTRRIYEKTSVTVAYSPVRGRHPNLKKHLLFWPKWISVLPLEKTAVIISHLKKLGFKVKTYKGSPETLELAKLWETVYRAIMIASWQELHRISLNYKADIVTIAEFIGEVHEILKDRPIYYPGIIGGHCLIPNTKILRDIYPSKLLDFVIDSNRRRAEEMMNSKIKMDVEKLKKLMAKYVNLEYYGEIL